MKKMRDFHVREADTALIEDLPELPWRGPSVLAEGRNVATGEVVTFRLRGELVFDSLVEMFRDRPEVRAFAVAEMRTAAWWIRYSRFSGTDSGMKAFVVFVEWKQVIEASGCPPADVEALVGCLMHACTCDGCDLANGARMTRGDWIVP